MSAAPTALGLRRTVTAARGSVVAQDSEVLEVRGWGMASTTGLHKQ